MADARGVLRGIHILVVEDDLDARDILGMVLTHFGASVATARTAREALRLMEHVATSVVVTDMALGPASDGTRLLREARRRGYTAPFIAISGMDFDAHELLVEGFDAYLRKPLDHRTIVETILAVVRAR
jgi:ATP-binding cassette, subfamily B, bacterial